jgi:NADH-quinone oxidoreductase subunit J
MGQAPGIWYFLPARRNGALVEAALFWTFATIAVAGAVGVVAARNPVHGAMSLVGALFALAGLFLLLEAQLVAALQVLVYAGAIMVLFVFVIMLLNLDAPEVAWRNWMAVGGITIILAGVAFALSLAMHSGALLFARAGEAQHVVHALGPDFGSVEQIGKLILTDLVLPFEMLSLLLLVAIVGAVVIAKRRL